MKPLVAFALLIACLGRVGAGDAPSPDPSAFVAALRQFADQAIARGRDTYGRPTPLFVDGVNVDTGEPVKWKWADGKEWVLCNLANQQGLLRTLDGLTRFTGERRYKAAALEAVRYAFDHLRNGTQRHGGLPVWGGHLIRMTSTERPAEGHPTWYRVFVSLVAVAQLLRPVSAAEPGATTAGLTTPAPIPAAGVLTSPGRPWASGPLRVHPGNPRYFTDDDQRAVYLTGSHTWNNLQDMGETDPPTPFDFDAYLDLMVRHDHNFVRLWRWEMFSSPHPWRRPGPGLASDGRPGFDLEQFEAAYFARLRARVAAARERGIYVSVMLFEGWGIQHVARAWKEHLFHPHNHINGLSLDADGDGLGLELHTLRVPDVTRVQDAYVRRVIETVNALDNVLFEIVNESGSYSTEFPSGSISRR